MQPDEAQLLWRLWRGDAQAFAETVDLYKAMVLNLAARMTGREDSAEDIAQEVFLRVWKGLPQFRGECKLSTWIYRITINLCIAETKTARGRSEFVAIDDPVWLRSRNCAPSLTMSTPMKSSSKSGCGLCSLRCRIITAQQFHCTI